MNTRKRWQRALIISIIFNLFLLGGIGILSVGFLQVEAVEELLELELVSDDSIKPKVENILEPVNTSSSIPQAMPINDNNSVAVNNTVKSVVVAVQPVTTLSVDEVSSNFSNDEIGERSSVASGATSTNAAGEGANAAGSGSVGKTQSNAGQGGVKPSGGIVRPQILSQVQPNYPESARQAGISGTVLLKVHILENGLAGDISVKQSSGNGLLDESAVNAVYKWRFTPATERNTGRAVSCYTTVPVVFRLN